MNRSHGLQMIGSLLAAAVIVAITIAVVTAKFGPTSAAEREAREERIELEAEQREDQAERREERRDELEERRDR